MKKVNLFLIGLITLFTLNIGLSSCSKDDDDKKNDKQNDIVGLWKFSDVTVDIENPENPELAEMAESMFQLAALVLRGVTIEFKTDNTFIFSTPSIGGINATETGTYSLDGEKVTMKSNEEDSQMDDLSEGTITLKNGVLIFEANSLNDIDEETGETYKDEGFTKYDTRMTFKK